MLFRLGLYSVRTLNLWTQRLKVFEAKKELQKITALLFLKVGFIFYL